jgi:hypothetical protein
MNTQVVLHFVPRGQLEDLVHTGGFCGGISGTQIDMWPLLAQRRPKEQHLLVLHWKVLQKPFSHCMCSGQWYFVKHLIPIEAQKLPS